VVVSYGIQGFDRPCQETSYDPVNQIFNSELNGYGLLRREINSLLPDQDKLPLSTDLLLAVYHQQSLLNELLPRLIDR
jgi:hypothetical protein